MARILKFEDFLTKRELDKITEFANREFSAPVKLHDRRPSPTERDLRIRLKRTTEPPKAA